MAAKKKVTKTGRPPKSEDEKEEHPIPVRFRKGEVELVKRAAAEKGLNLSQFLRQAALRDVRETLGLSE